MELPIEVLKELNMPNLIAMGAMLWFMYSRIEKKFEKIDQRFEKIDQRFEKIDQRFEKIEDRLFILETDMIKFNCNMVLFNNDIIEIKTILRMKECCMINDDRQIKKAE